MLRLVRQDFSYFIFTNTIGRVTIAAQSRILFSGIHKGSIFSQKGKEMVTGIAHFGWDQEEKFVQVAGSLAGAEAPPFDTFFYPNGDGENQQARTFLNGADGLGIRVARVDNGPGRVIWSDRPFLISAPVELWIKVFGLPTEVSMYNLWGEFEDGLIVAIPCLYKGMWEYIREGGVGIPDFPTLWRQYH